MKDTILKLLAYEYWANNETIKILKTVDVPPERSLQVMAHILSAQEVWFNRMVGEVRTILIWQEIPINKLNEKAELTYQRMRAYIENLDEDQFIKDISYTNSKGEPFTNSLQDICIHLSHHAAYHRGQVIQLIRLLITDVPLLDYIFWVRENQI